MRSRFGLVLPVLAWLLCNAAPPAFAGDSQWVEVRSPHFSVVTDGGEKRGRDVAVRFEQMRAVFGALLAKASVNLSVPLQIVAFRNTKELRQFAPLWNGKPTQVAGLFQGNSDRSFILLDLSVENPWAVVFHEYAHQLMNSNTSAQTDPWFDEGFAEYFSSIEVDGKEARVGRIPEDTYLILQQAGLMKTADLFRVRQDSSTYNESGDRRGGFYAQSSMMVHYLYDHNLIPKLATYFDLTIDQKVSVEDAIQKSFGMSAADFDKQIRAYIASGHFTYYKLPTPAGIVTTNYKVTPLSTADGNAVLADVHLHSPDYGSKAMEEFEAILKADPTNAAALRGLGFAYLQKQDFGKANVYFQKAAQGNSKDPRVHYYAALLMSREKALGDPANIPVMTKELETSIALDPDFPDAYSLLAFAYAYGGHPDKGLETMKKAVALSPRNDMYTFNLAQMYVNNRKPADAIQLLQGLQSSPQPVIATRARQMLSEAMEMKQALDSGANVLIGAPLDVDDTETSSSSEKEDPADGKNGEIVILPAQPAPQFVKGNLVKVDCRTPPEATMNVAAGGKVIKLHVADTKRVLMMSSDTFSCDWSNRKVGVNYRETGDGTGEVVSVELQ